MAGLVSVIDRSDFPYGTTTERLNLGDAIDFAGAFYQHHLELAPLGPQPWTVARSTVRDQ